MVEHVSMWLDPIVIRTHPGLSCYILDAFSGTKSSTMLAAGNVRSIMTLMLETRIYMIMIAFNSRSLIRILRCVSVPESESRTADVVCENAIVIRALPICTREKHVQSSASILSIYIAPTTPQVPPILAATQPSIKRQSHSQ
jgi:hypothetical protein